jgi:hypothetical protein
MYKKYIQTLLLLGFFWTPTCAMSGGAPGGAEPWQDTEHRAAPARVRAAIDALWNAVEAEGDAALDVGWGFAAREYETINPKRTICCLLTCGISWCGATKYDPKEFQRFRYHIWSTPAKDIHFQQTSEAVGHALTLLKQTVNTFVSRAEGYSGDATICELGNWTRNGKWTVSEGFIESAQRDLSAVNASVMRFVNAHGGWAAEGVQAKEVSLSKPVVVAVDRGDMKASLLGAQH